MKSVNEISKALKNTEAKTLITIEKDRRKLKGEEKEFRNEFDDQLLDLKFLEENALPDDDYG